MNFEVKKFEKLDTFELYEVLKLRSQVFVVEQNCVYQDVDGKDLKALHILGKKENKIVAYARCFKPGDYFENASIGRVVVDIFERKSGLGHLLMKASIEAVETHFKTQHIKISAQEYLISFYQTHGFEVVGEGYLEDGIPHVGMVRG